MTTAAGNAPASVYQRVLGDAYGDLPPVLARYFGPLPPGHVGVGEGTYDTVGSRYRLIVWPLLVWSTRHDVLFPEAGEQVPFLVENRPLADGLAGSRWFAFPGRLRVMRDTMRAGDGEIIERIGRRGGLEVRLRPAVADGRMVLRSGRLAWRVRGIRVPLPRVASVTVQEVRARAATGVSASTFGSGCLSSARSSGTRDRSPTASCATTTAAQECRPPSLHCRCG